MAKAWSGWLPSDALDAIKKWVDAYKHTHKSERQLWNSPQLKDVCITSPTVLCV